MAVKVQETLNTEGVWSTIFYHIPGCGLLGVLQCTNCSFSGLRIYPVAEGRRPWYASLNLSQV